MNSLTSGAGGPHNSCYELQEKIRIKGKKIQNLQKSALVKIDFFEDSGKQILKCVDLI